MINLFSKILTPEDHPNLAAYLNNRAIMLGRHYKLTQNMDGLEEAIHKTEEAVKATPEDRPDLAAGLNNLCIMLDRQYELTES